MTEYIFPEEWSENRLKYILKAPLMYGLNEPAEDENTEDPRYIRITDFDENENLKNNTYKSITLSKANGYLLQDGDILFARSGATVGKSFMYREHNGIACFAGYLIRARLNNNIIDNEYFSYFSKSYYYDTWKSKTNIQSTIQNISAEKYNQLTIYYPSLSQQKKIVYYLTEHCSYILQRLSLLEKKRDNYLRLKKSLINQVVSKGLNPNVEMKDSGLDWLGEIPEHWEIKRIKSFTQAIKGKSIDYKDEPFDGSKVLLSLDYLRNDSVTFKSYCCTFDKTQHATSNDIIIIWDGAGVGEILKAKYGIISSTTAKIIINDKVFLKSFFYHIRFNLEYKLKQLPSGMGIPHLNPQIFNSFQCPCPPLSEQQTIADYLDDKCIKIDAIVENIEKQIEKLKDLKKSLINEVVTGQRKIEP